MSTFISTITMVVPDCDAAIEFYVGALGFELQEDVDSGGGVKIAPPGGQSAILLARVDNEGHSAAISNQIRGRASFFLQTDCFQRDYERLASKGVRFREAARWAPWPGRRFF